MTTINFPSPPPVVTTNFDPKYAIENIVPQYEIDYLDGTVEFRRDYLGSSLVRAIKRINQYTPYVYRAFEPLTTIAYKAYGNTTLYWVIMIYNGIMSPLEMIPGSIIRIPVKSTVDYLISKANSNVTPSNIGKQVSL